MHRGYIKLWRKLRDNPLWLSEPFTRGQAWVDLLMLANHKKNTVAVRGIMVAIESGQILAGEQFLADRWKWSRGKVRRFMSHLEQKTVQQIVQQKNNVCTVVSITNWKDYQGNSTTDGTASSTTDGQQKDNRRTTDGHTEECISITSMNNNSKADPVNPPEKKPKQTRFIPPTIKEVEQYCRDRKNRINAQKFIDHYTTTGWMRGKNKIKDWKACVRTWEGNGNNRDPDADRAKQKVEEDRKLARADKYLKGHGINAEAKRL